VHYEADENFIEVLLQVYVDQGGKARRRAADMMLLFLVWFYVESPCSLTLAGYGGFQDISREK